MPTFVGSYFFPCITVLHAAVLFDAEGAGFLDGGDQFLKQHVEGGVRRKIQSVKTCVGSEIQTVIVFKTFFEIFRKMFSVSTVKSAYKELTRTMTICSL